MTSLFFEQLGPGWYFAHVQAEQNLDILCILKGTLLLGTAHLVSDTLVSSQWRIEWVAALVDLGLCCSYMSHLMLKGPIAYPGSGTFFQAIVLDACSSCWTYTPFLEIKPWIKPHFFS